MTKFPFRDRVGDPEFMALKERMDSLVAFNDHLQTRNRELEDDRSAFVLRIPLEWSRQTEQSPMYDVALTCLEFRSMGTRLVLANNWCAELAEEKLAEVADNAVAQLQEQIKANILTTLQDARRQGLHDAERRR